MKAVMDNMLKDMGMSNSTDKPVKHCDECGEVRPVTEVEHPFKNKMFWAVCACPCVIESMDKFEKDQFAKSRKLRIERALKLSSAMEDIKSMTFSNFKRREGTESARTGIIDAVKNFKKLGKLGVLIFGETGNGKSHLTAAGGNELIDQGYAVIFITEQDLMSRLQATRNFRNEESFGEIMNACLEADLLIWDDFMSSQRLSNDERDWIFQIFNGRERANKPIWATSNLTPEEFESPATAYKLDDKGRTWWRIVGNMNCIFNQGKNHRQSQAMARMMNVSIDEYESGNRR